MKAHTRCIGTPVLYLYIEATSKWSQKPLYFETLFLGPDFGPRGTFNALKTQPRSTYQDATSTNNKTIQQEAS